jgi:hypothetical protein
MKATERDQPMRNITETNMLLRAKIELPDGSKLTKDEFRDGWNVVRSEDARRLHNIFQFDPAISSGEQN